MSIGFSPISALMMQQSAVGQMMASPVMSQATNASGLFSFGQSVPTFTQPQIAPQNNFLQQLLKMMLLQQILKSFSGGSDNIEDQILEEDRDRARDISDSDLRRFTDRSQGIEERNKFRTDLSGLSDRDRAVLHLWGRQMIAKGKQDGGILVAAQNNARQVAGANNGAVGGDIEAQLADELIAKDQARDGGITGRALDEEYFKVFEKITGKDISARYKDAPINFYDGVPATIPTDANGIDEAEMQRRSGLSGYENAVLRLWGHNPLFTGKIDGSILALTLNNSGAFDKDLNKDDVRSLLEDDLAADGIVNGDSMESSFLDVMDKLYLKTEGASREKTKTDMLTRAERIGRTAQQISRDTTDGVQDAISSVGDLFKNHPIMSSVGAGGLAAAMIICPFLAGMGMGGAALAFGSKLLGAQE